MTPGGSGGSGSSSPWTPSGVAFTIRSTSNPEASSNPTTCTAVSEPSSAARRSSVREASRTATDRLASPHRATASAHARAPPPAPNRSADRPDASNPTSSRRNRSNPTASELWPASPSAPTTIVLAARRRRASSDRSSISSAVRVLCGIVTFAPANPSAPSPRSAVGSSAGATGSGTWTQSKPSATKAALWIAGDRLCSTGHPSTPTERVEPRTRPVRSGTSLTAADTVGLVLGGGLPERVVPVLAAQHIEEVGRVRRLQGRLEGGSAGTRDRRRRQSRVDPRVVRAVVLQVGEAELAVRRRVVVQERRVDAEGHPSLQPVVDHARDDRALAIQRGLPLDHRRDDHHLVRRHPELLRVGPRQRLGLGAELVEQPPDDPVGV